MKLPATLSFKEIAYLAARKSGAKHHNALVDAGFMPNSEASKNLLLNPIVARALEAIEKASKMRKLIDDDVVFMETARVGLARISDVLRPDGIMIPLDEWSDENKAALKRITFQTLPGGEVVPVPEFYDKQKSLDTLAKINGMLREKVELTGKDGDPLFNVDMLDRARQRVERMSSELLPKPGEEIIDV